MDPTRRAFVAAALVAVILAPSATAAYPEVTAVATFADGMSVPVGVALDEDGYVWVASENVTPSHLTRFDADGLVANQLAYGNIGSIEAGTAMDLDPETGWTWMLSSTGVVSLLDP